MKCTPQLTHNQQDSETKATNPNPSTPTTTQRGSCGPLGPEPPPPDTPTPFVPEQSFTIWRGLPEDASGTRARQNKAYRRNPQTGKTEKVRGADQARYHEIRRESFRYLSDINGTLDKLQKDPTAYICVAQLLHTEQARGRRGQFGPTVDGPSCLCIVDIDGYAGCTALNPTPAMLRKVVSEVLPPCFHRASFLAHFSGSHGIKDGLCAHLAFLFDTPLVGRERLALLDTGPRDERGNLLVDRQGAVWAQVIYTAEPEHDGSTPLPTHRRILVEGEFPKVAVPSGIAQISLENLDVVDGYPKRSTPNPKASSAAPSSHRARSSSHPTSPPTDRPQRPTRHHSGSRFALSPTSLNRVVDRLPVATERPDWWSVGSALKTWNDDGPHGFDAFVRYTRRCVDRHESNDPEKVRSAWVHDRMGYEDIGPEIARALLEKCIERGNLSPLPRRKNQAPREAKTEDASTVQPLENTDDIDGLHVTLSEEESRQLDEDMHCMVSGEPLPQRTIQHLPTSTGTNPADVFDDGRTPVIVDNYKMWEDHPRPQPAKLQTGLEGMYTPLMQWCEDEHRWTDRDGFAARFVELRREITNTIDPIAREDLAAELWCVVGQGALEVRCDIFDAVERADNAVEGWEHWRATSSPEPTPTPTTPPERIEVPTPAKTETQQQLAPTEEPPEDFDFFSLI